MVVGQVGSDWDVCLTVPFMASGSERLPAVMSDVSSVYGLWLVLAFIYNGYWDPLL